MNIYRAMIVSNSPEGAIDLLKHEARAFVALQGYGANEQMINLMVLFALEQVRQLLKAQIEGSTEEKYDA